MATQKQKEGLIKKMVEVNRIIANESSSSRIDESFNVKQENRKFRKTLEYIGRIKTNNYLDPSIILREERTENDFHFVCVEGAARISAIKTNPKIKYLKCSVSNAIKGTNEVKSNQIRNDQRDFAKSNSIEITFDAPETVKKQYSKKLNLSRSKLPTMGKL